MNVLVPGVYVVFINLKAFVVYSASLSVKALYEMYRDGIIGGINGGQQHSGVCGSKFIMCCLGRSSGYIAWRGTGR